MLEVLITSKTRVKLLLKFFLNPAARGYLRNLASEFKESTNAVRVELNRLENAGILVSVLEGNKRLFFANRKHPLFDDLTRLVHKYVGVDQIITMIALRVGNVSKVFLTGPIVRGIDNGIIQIILVGENMDQNYIYKLASRVEILIKKKISYACLDSASFEDYLEKNEPEQYLIYEKTLD